MKKKMRPLAVASLVFSAAFWGAMSPALSAQQSGPAAQAERQQQENLSASAGLSTNTAELQKADTGRAEAKPAADDIVVKTYSLKYVDWRELVEAARFYLVQWTGSGNTLTVMIRKNNVADFEVVLKKLDVEKKNIMFRVYTVIAAKDVAPDIIKKPETREIDNRDLKTALDEVKGLWNFKRYWVDAPSFLTVKDGSGGSHVKLVSGLLDYADFGLSLRNVRLSGDEPNRRNVTVGELKLDLNVNAPNVSRSSTLIDTQEISVKEKGYLIVGVSGLETGYSGQSTSWSGLALILVISAEVK